MMKAKDCAVATALVLNGYLRANEGEATVGDFANAKAMLDAPLVAAIAAIRGECRDWAENLDDGNDRSAIPRDKITIELTLANGAEVVRTPYNLLEAAMSLVAEAVDLNGPTMITEARRELDALTGRVVTAAPKPDALTAEQRVLVDGLDALVARIDAATDRPVAELALFDVGCNHLRALGVKVEDVVTAPQNW